MRLLKPGLRPLLALFVIAHGLAHAVLPLRGWLDPGQYQMPFILYAVAVMGFAVAGIGLLGVTPFTAAVRPCLVLASAYSLVALFTLGDSSLWWGGAADLVLLVIGLSGVYRRLPPAGSHPGWPHRLAVVSATTFLVVIGYALVLWPVQRPWH